MSTRRRGNAGWLWRRTRRLLPLFVMFVGAHEARREDSSAGARGRDVGLSLGDFGPADAHANIDWGFDADADGLPDEVELLVGGSPFLADTDGDGFNDSIEFACGSRVDDPTSVPDVKPALRTRAYEIDGKIRIFCAVYPANLDLIDSFHCVAGSASFIAAPEGDPGTGLGILDITAMLPSVAHSYTTTNHLGLDLVGFSFDFDRTQTLQSLPLTLGFASKLAGVTVCDELMLTSSSGSGSLVLAGGPVVASGDASYAIEPLDPTGGGGGEDPEYCALGFSAGTPVGLGSIQYSVTSANCAPDGLLYCINADCTALQGQTFMMIDYGFLQSKADQ